jgi:hypothetical protein
VEPQFVKFVRAVEGRLVSRWDVGPTQYFGARLGTPEERADGKAIIWDTDVVIPLMAPFVARFTRELTKAVRHGDLKVATEEEYRAWLEVEKARDDAATSERKRVAEDAAKAGASPADDTPPTDGPPVAASTKSEKRK